MVESLSVELKISIKLLWGARGHSELAEIEHSWNFIKGFIKKFNPNNAKETKTLLKTAELLDFSNKQSWRNRIILVIDCYTTHGYFNDKLLRIKYKNRESILSKWQTIFSDISTQYDFTDTGFNLFKNNFQTKISKQLLYNEIPSCIYYNLPKIIV